MLAIILAHGFAISDDGSEATDGCPFVGSVEKRDVDVRVGGEVVRFAGVGVGVEKEVYAAVLLVGRALAMPICLCWARGKVVEKRSGVTHTSSNSHTPTNQHPCLRIPRRHHSKFVRLSKFHQCLNLFFKRNILLCVLRLVRVGGGGASGGRVASWVRHCGVCGMK